MHSVEAPSEYDPVPHVVQSAEPLWLLKVPASHATHTDAPEKSASKTWVTSPNMKMQIDYGQASFILVAQREEESRVDRTREHSDFGHSRQRCRWQNHMGWWMH